MNILWALYIYFLAPLLSILVWLIIINAVLSWLIAFNVVNPSNQFVGMFARFTYSITEPLLRPFRRFVPSLGGVDITPILLILSIYFVKGWLLPQVITAIVGTPGGF